MRLFFIATLALLLGVSFVQFFLTRQRNFGKKTYGFSWFPYVWVSLAVAIVPAVFFELQWQSTQRTLREVAGVFSERTDVSVSCQRAGGAMLFAGAQAGQVRWEEGDERGTGSEVWLTYEVCSQIRKWLHTGKDGVSVDDATALHVFSHEVAHVSGYRDESETECVALAQDVKLFTFLGADMLVAEQLKRIYQDNVYPFLPQEYKTNCST